MIRALLLIIVTIDVVISTFTHKDLIESIRDNSQVQPSDEYSVQMENTALMGTPKCFNCLNIGIVGAGVSGLTAALELSLSGHNITIYEATNRTGGRILTYRHPTGGYMTELGFTIGFQYTIENIRFNLPIVSYIIIHGYFLIMFK
jgi:protoporphyrinogen oxidase